MNLDDATLGYDKPPVYGSDLVAASAEKALASMVESIAEFDPNLVFLGASDVRDVLFVGAFLRRRFDNAPLVVLDSDVLYGSSPTNALDGMLAVSTYAVQGSEWSETDSDVMEFTSQISNGIYNAALLLLGQPKTMWAYDGQEKEKPPPLWLTVMSGGRNWPVANLPTAQQSWLGNSERNPLKIRLGRQPLEWFLFCFALAGIAIAFAKSHKSKLLESLFPAKPSVSQLLAGVALFLVLVDLLLVQALCVKIFGDEEHGLGVLFPILNLAVLGIGLALLLWKEVTVVCQLKNAWVYIVALLVAQAAATVLMIWVPVSLAQEAEFHTFPFYLHRSFHVFSGVSPLVPPVFFLFVTFLWAWTELHRKENLLDPPDPNSRYLAAAIAILLVAGLAYSLQTLEPTAYESLFSLTLLGATAGPIYSLLQLVLSYFQFGRMPNSVPDEEDPKKRSPMDLHALALIRDASLQTYFLAATIVLVIFAFRYYPFYPRGTFIHLASVFFLLVASITLLVYARLKANPYLNKLYGSTRVSALDTVFWQVSTVLLPLLTVLASQFPELSSSISEWIKAFSDTAK